MRRVAVDDEVADWARYPFSLPVVAALRGRRLEFGPGVTFLVGENGSGKSTLIEALAVAAGLNPEGGSRHFRFTTRSTESELGGALTVSRAPGRERSSFFLRAETFYNVASEIEARELELAPYGGVSLHERSHGQSFLDLLTHRFRPNGLYLLDEPEAALSPQGQLAALTRIDQLTRGGSQFLIATHSPILPALPGARILQIDADGGLHTVAYDDCLPVRATREFLADPAATLRHLL
ncbi:AAA family ATPase [Pseudonocardia oroxyli]|uniref:AAA family ATPase n=1 Tax=Pseudonocardia oroxyli TaxID=366584 RepID=UPI002481A05D|nr:AAA family ATPase [Pseudonocardia oroxyli]